MPATIGRREPRGGLGENNELNPGERAFADRDY